MKKRFYQTLGVLLIIITMFCFHTCEIDNDEIYEEVLTNQEKSDLLTLREEEKLARDLYFYAYKRYGLEIFNTIGTSEEKHMSRVLQIMNRYALDDIVSQLNGVFINTNLQELYNDFKSMIDLSPTDAFIIFTTIEDLDIRDIEDFMRNTSKTDILIMYDNLACGSRNHFRACYKQVVSEGGSYTPKYISEKNFYTITNSPNENCWE